MNAKIRDIRSVRAGDLSEYRIELMSLNDTLYKQSPGMGLIKKAMVMVKHRWSYELPGEFRIDEDIGIPLRDGDNIVIVGYAGWFISMNRNMTVDGEGTIILLLTEEEYKTGTHRTAPTHDILLAHPPVIFPDRVVLIIFS
jgi:hypothetical protein